MRPPAMPCCSRGERAHFTVARREAARAASAYSEALTSFAAQRIRDAREAISATGVAVAPMTGPIADTAAELRANHDRLRPPDAIVPATAIELEARLLTYDDDLARIAAVV